MLNIDTYEFRCSALGKIISKSGKLTDQNKTYLRELWIGETYKVRKEITSKYFEKGLFEEESGFDLLGQTLYRGKLILKNKERKRNGFIHGECDTVINATVYDIKNAWDLFTFGKADLTHDYKWQLVGYATLWNVDKAGLFYCLNNTPEHIMIDEEKRLFWQNKYISIESPDYIKDCEELRAKHNYDSLPLEERFKLWEFDVTEDMKEELQEAVKAARNYLKTLQTEYEERIALNKQLMS